MFLLDRNTLKWITDFDFKTVSLYDGMNSVGLKKKFTEFYVELMQNSLLRLAYPKEHIFSFSQNVCTFGDVETGD